MSSLLKDLPDDWEFSTLGDLNSRKAPTLNPKNFEEETFEYYSIPDFQRDQRPSLTKGGAIESSKLLLKPKTVLFGKLNPRVEKVWRVAESPECRQIGSTEWITILPTDRVDADFLYFLEWSDHVMPIAKTLVSGSTPSRQRVDPKSFYRLRVPLPPLPEQKKIAHILSTVQRAIEAQERIIQTTTELKKALMHKLFTEGLRNEPQKQTEIGPVPESWEVVELETLFEKQPQNGIYKHKRDYGSGTQILRIDDFSNDGDVVTRAGNLVALARSEIETYGLEPGDIVINRVNSLSHLGKTALIGEIGDEMVFESNMMRFSVDESEVVKEYVFKFLNSPLTKKQVIGTAKRAVAQSSINQGDVKSIIVPKPSLEEQCEIVATLDATEAKIAHSTNKAAVLQDLFRTVLHELMTARTRVHKTKA